MIVGVMISKLITKSGGTIDVFEFEHSGNVPFNSLVNSKAHYNNMTNARWTRVGVGVAKSNGWWMYGKRIISYRISK